MIPFWPVISILECRSAVLPSDLRTPLRARPRQQGMQQKLQQAAAALPLELILAAVTAFLIVKHRIPTPQQIVSSHCLDCHSCHCQTSLRSPVMVQSFIIYSDPRSGCSGPIQSKLVWFEITLQTTLASSVRIGPVTRRRLMLLFSYS